MWKWALLFSYSRERQTSYILYIMYKKWGRSWPVFLHEYMWFSPPILDSFFKLSTKMFHLPYWSPWNKLCPQQMKMLTKELVLWGGSYQVNFSYLKSFYLKQILSYVKIYPFLDNIYVNYINYTSIKPKITSRSTLVGWFWDFVYFPYN